MELDQALRKKLLSFQKDEITSHIIYKDLSEHIKDEHNSDVVKRMSAEEIRHYNTWKHYTKTNVEPDRFKIFWYKLLSRLFGFTFGIKLLERGENDAIDGYEPLSDQLPEVMQVLAEENAHEETLIAMLDEESLKYSGSVVLGLNDALVELTGALAGLTLAFQNTRMIALSGLVTGVAAALSMAASEFLSTSTEKTEKDPVKASVYTGIAYIVTVGLMILPYLVFSNYYLALGIMLATVIMIIALFSYYSAVIHDEPFHKRFLVMAAISLGVAGFSFALGYVLKNFLGLG